MQENILDEGQGLKSPGSHLYVSLLPPTTPFNPAPTPWYQGRKASAKVQHEKCPLMIRHLTGWQEPEIRGSKGMAGRMDHP